MLMTLNYNHYYAYSIKLIANFLLSLIEEGHNVYRSISKPSVIIVVINYLFFYRYIQCFTIGNTF